MNTRNVLGGLFGQAQVRSVNQPGSLPLSALANALAERHREEPTLANLLQALGTQPSAPTMQNALVGLAGPTAFPWSTAPLPATRRNTFFSFHFDDSFRVNQVRNSGLIRPKAGASPLWWRDSSIWEAAKAKGDLAVSRLILNGLQSTSVTCVLAGQHTWQREWVRFEIAKSVARGNGLLTVDIWNLQCPNGGFGIPGFNPLDYVGAYFADDGKAYLCEQDPWGTWRKYARHQQAITWPGYLPMPPYRNQAQPFSRGARRFDYLVGDGYTNLSTWIQAAAVDAGR